MKFLISLFLVCTSVFFSGCHKEPGAGGTSSITGRVYAKYYDKSFFVLTDSGYAPNVEVFIIYGDQSTYGNSQKTSYDGTYDFKYLQPGAYKVYVYTRDSAGFYLHQVNITAPKKYVLKNVQISKSYQIVPVDDINVEL